LGAGFGRTGTLTLKVALEELQLGPCYHMVELFKNMQHVDDWERVTFGETIDWENILAKYQSGVDWPIAAFWRQLMDVYPDAKIILTIRDPERWYESMEATILRVRAQNERFPMTLLTRLSSRAQKMLRTMSKLMSDNFPKTVEDKASAIEEFKKHVELGTWLYLLLCLVIALLLES